MDHEQQTHLNPVEKETVWTDDSIRWSKEELHHHHDNEPDEGAAADIFRDANPMDTFEFQIPNGTSVSIQGLKSDSDQVWTSTGLTLWKASEHMCRYLTTHSERLLKWRDDMRILELGAGLGLVGIVASRLAPEDSTVYLTDGDTNALRHLRENVEQNVPPSSNVSCHQLLWGHDTATCFQERFGARFDLILASDILYAPCVIEPLWETVRALLDNQTGVFVTAFATRQVKVTIDDFIHAASKDFEHKCVDVNEEEGVYVYEFTWKEHDL